MKLIAIALVCLDLDCASPSQLGAHACSRWLGRHNDILTAVFLGWQRPPGYDQSVRHRRRFKNDRVGFRQCRSKLPFGCHLGVYEGRASRSTKLEDQSSPFQELSLVFPVSRSCATSRACAQRTEGPNPRDTQVIDTTQLWKSESHREAAVPR